MFSLKHTIGVVHPITVLMQWPSGSTEKRLKPSGMQTTLVRGISFQATWSIKPLGNSDGFIEIFFFLSLSFSMTSWELRRGKGRTVNNLGWRYLQVVTTAWIHTEFVQCLQPAPRGVSGAGNPMVKKSPEQSWSCGGDGDRLVLHEKH